MCSWNHASGRMRMKTSAGMPKSSPKANVLLKSCGPSITPVSNLSKSQNVYAIPDRDTTAELYCSKALNVLRGELRIITFELSHPTFAGQNEKMFVSPLHLSEGFHPTNLVEIITPFFEMGLCVTAEKRLAKLTEIIRVFEWAFNITIPNYAVLRNAAINRKIHQTPLLDKMREILIRLSQQ